MDILDTIVEIWDLRRTCFLYTKDELQQKMDEMKQQAEQDPIGLKQKEYLLAKLVVYDAIYIDPGNREVEDIYLKLVEQPWEDDEDNFPFELKLKFLELLFAQFDDQGHYSRSLKILKLIEDLVEKHPDDKHLADCYIYSLSMQSIDLIAFRDPDIEKYIAKIDDVISKHDFDSKQLAFYGYLKDKVYTDYYSSHWIEKGFKYLEKMIDYSINKIEIKSVYWINVSIDQMMGYANRYLDEWQPYLVMLVSASDYLLENRADKNDAILNIHGGMVQVAIHIKNEKKGEALAKVKYLIDVLEKSEVEYYCKLNFDILLYLMWFSLDPDNLDQAIIMDLKKKFIKFADLIDTEDAYLINYTVIGLFGTLCQILSAMGMKLPPETLKKLIDYFEPQEYTFIKFVSSLESYLVEEIKEPVEKAHNLIKESGAHELSSIKLTVELQNICLGFTTSDPVSLNLLFEKLKVFTRFLKDNRDKYDYVDVKLQHCYQVIIPALIQASDVEMFMECAQDQIEYIMKVNEPIDNVLENFKMLLGIYMNRGSHDKVALLAKKVYDYTKKTKSKKDKTYVEIMKMLMTGLRSANEYVLWYQLLPDYEQAVIEVSTKNSADYIEVLKDKSAMYLQLGRPQESYKLALDTLDLAKNIYGSDNNPDASDILTIMVMVKLRIGQWDEARKLINKAKEIEESVSSKHSQRYMMLLEFEKQVDSEATKQQKREDIRNRAQNKGKGVLKKLAPNTPFKFGLYLTAIAAVSIGAIYLLKKRKD